ncbi:MAG: hypothetical protein J6X50_02655 [Bacilli bacterium]|nr:hypothetical protein [Bacilli bacterium]
MTNFQVYKKTLSFSLLEFLVGLLSLVIALGIASAGFFIFNSSIDKALIGLAIGLLIGIIVAALINVFVTNRIKAAQIAMMTKGVTEDALPDHTFKEGFVEIKGRFGKITAFYFITNAIKGIFRQIGRGVNRVGTAVGGQAGNTVTSAIDSAVQTLVSYLCDCCLGWILFRKDENSLKAGCEGAVIFFKHGKTLIRNIGRIFGMGILSFILIGGALTAVFYLIFTQLPQMFNIFADEIAQTGDQIPEFLTDPKMLMLAVAVAGGIILWAMLHSVLIRPFILVGVLRNFMAAGQKDMPKEEDFKALSIKSPRFAKLYNKAQ